SSAWFHLGDCQAVLESRLMLVNPMHFAEVVKRNPSAWLLVTTYCRKFLEWLNSMDVDDLSDISQGEDLGELLKSFMELCVESVESEVNDLVAMERPEDDFQITKSVDSLTATARQAETA
ncbi:unnamed protein product, partial [Prorocentrum cordatum]